MSIKTKLSAGAIASSILFAAYSGQAAPVVYDDLTDFNNALGGHSLEVEDFESFSDAPSALDFGDFVVETASGVQGSHSGHGTNGPRTLKTYEPQDDYVTFVFDTPIQAFRIDMVDALDTGGGDIDVTIDGEFINFIDHESLPNENLLFLGIIDWNGFTTVTIDGSDSGDKIYYDNLQYSSGFELQSAEAAAVPEPATLLTFGLGLAGLGLIRRRRIL